MSTMTITEFLTARLDEDEDRAALYRVLARDVGRRYGSATLPTTGQLDTADAAHVALLRTSERIRTDVAAKRAIVAMHGQAVAIDAVLDLLALPYAEHEDYDEGWRP